MKNTRIMLLCLLFISLFSTLSVFAQDNELKRDANSLKKIDQQLLQLGVKDHDGTARGNKGIRLAFYNVENLFDIYNHPVKRDDEFTPKGMKGWSARRYKEKLNNIYKTTMALGGWEAPAIMGFCEVENRAVLEDLLDKTPLKKFGYEIVHEESTDRRGIDVGLIYRKNKFQYISHDIIRIVFPFDTAVKTRDVLYVQGRVLNKDTLHVFINHWPSRRGGQAKSEPKRTYVAAQVRKKIDSIYAVNPQAKIVVTGDFNDEAENKSVIEVLRAKGEKEHVTTGDLYNYMYALSKNWQLGSHKYQNHWGTIDHMIISEPLLHEKRPNHLYASEKGAKIFAARFLLEEDPKFMGLRPFRTYGGPRFLGGFSDHLPIYIDLMYREEE